MQEKEVLVAMEVLATGKQPGPNRIPNELYKRECLRTAVYRGVTPYALSRLVVYATSLAGGHAQRITCVRLRRARSV